MYGPGPYPVHPEVFARPELHGPPYLRTRQAHPAHPAGLHAQPGPAQARPASSGSRPPHAVTPHHAVTPSHGTPPVRARSSRLPQGEPRRPQEHAAGLVGRAGRAELVSAGDAVLRRAVAVLRHRDGAPGETDAAEGLQEEGRAALALVRGAGRLYRDAAEGVVP